MRSTSTQTTGHLPPPCPALLPTDLNITVLGLAWDFGWRGVSKSAFTKSCVRDAFIKLYEYINLISINCCLKILKYLCNINFSENCRVCWSSVYIVFTFVIFLNSFVYLLLFIYNDLLFILFIFPFWEAQEEGKTKGGKTTTWLPQRTLIQITLMLLSLSYP